MSGMGFEKYVNAGATLWKLLQVKRLNDTEAKQQQFGTRKGAPVLRQLALLRHLLLAAIIGVKVGVKRL